MCIISKSLMLTVADFLFSIMPLYSYSRQLHSNYNNTVLFVPFKLSVLMFEQHL